MSATVNDKVHGPPGYTVINMEPAELAALREIIREQWLYRLQLVVPREIHKFAAISMDQYHTLSHLVDHANIWPKTSRVLPARGVNLVRSMAFFKRLEAEFGEVLIGDEEHFGWPNVTWRLVRPRQKDVGPIHADEWFYEVRHHDKPDDYIPIKIWTAVYCNAGRNGLKIVPGSHWETDKHRYRKVDRNGLMVPAYDGNEADLPVFIPKTNPGDAIVFNHFLLHGGVWNEEETTRVSIDFTILVPKKFKIDRPKA